MCIAYLKSLISITGNRRFMKKLIIVLALLSTQVMAAGPVYEKGVDSPKTLSCVPPTTRTDGTPLVPGVADDNLRTVITTKNVDTNITETANANATCTKVYDFTDMAVGQYEITATAVDESIFSRESVSSETYYFLVKPQTMPPNAPTGLQLQ